MWKAYALVRQLDAAAEMHVVLRNWIVGQSYLGAVAICDNEKPSSVCQESTSGLDLLVTFDAALECQIACGLRLNARNPSLSSYGSMCVVEDGLSSAARICDLFTMTTLHSFTGSCRRSQRWAHKSYSNYNSGEPGAQSSAVMTGRTLQPPRSADALKDTPHLGVKAGQSIVGLSLESVVLVSSKM